METITGPLHVVHCLPMDSHHRWPVMWEAFRCHDSIIINLHFPVRIWSKMAQAEIILSAAILDGLVTKITDVLRTQICVKRVFFYWQRSQPALGLRHWWVLVSCKTVGCIYSCAKPNVEVKASIMDIQQVIPLHMNNGCNHISMP